MKTYLVNVTFIAEIEAKSKKAAEEKAVDMIKGSASIEDVVAEEKL